jgi:hypothetical protein
MSDQVHDRVLENLQVYRVRFGGSSKLLIEGDLRRGAPRTSNAAGTDAAGTRRKRKDRPGAARPGRTGNG